MSLDLLNNLKKVGKTPPIYLIEHVTNANQGNHLKYTQLLSFFNHCLNQCELSEMKQMRQRTRLSI